MKIKIMIVCFGAVFMLLAISYATAINNSNVEAKESPLFTIRTKISLSQNIGKIFEKIKINFIGNRIFFQTFFPNINNGRINLLIGHLANKNQLTIACKLETWEVKTCRCPLLRQ